MSKIKVLENIREFFGKLTGGHRLSELDFGILKTAMMVSALDGEIGDEEIRHFRKLVEGCCETDNAEFDALWDAALRSTGYIFMQARFLPAEKLVSVFVSEAEKFFVGEVKMEPTVERKRAFEWLESMARTDGDYSEVERQCITALAKRVQEAREQAIAERYPRAFVSGK